MNNTDNGTTTEMEVIEGVIWAVNNAQHAVNSATYGKVADKIDQVTWERLLVVQEQLREANAALQAAQFEASRW